jgi:hypothetical protein
MIKHHVKEEEQPGGMFASAQVRMICALDRRQDPQAGTRKKARSRTAHPPREDSAA